MIRAVLESDADRLCLIYNHYIENSTITFEERVIDTQTMAARLSKVKEQGLPWLVLEHGRELLGYAYATPWRERSAYRYSVEISVYLNPLQLGQGYGSALYTALFDALRTLDNAVHLAIGGITLPNPASIALHEKFGMQQVAHFREVGRKFDQWLDVGYWQCCIAEIPDAER